MSLMEKKQLKERIQKFLMHVGQVLDDVGRGDEEMESLLDDLKSMDKALDSFMGRKKRKVQDMSH